MRVSDSLQCVIVTVMHCCCDDVRSGVPVGVLWSLFGGLGAEVRRRLRPFRGQVGRSIAFVVPAIESGFGIVMLGECRGGRRGVLEIKETVAKQRNRYDIWLKKGIRRKA